MTNNDILRRIRYVFDYKDQEVIEIFALAQRNISQSELLDWLQAEEDPAYKECDDKTLAEFLNGLITKLRGPKDGEKKAPETKLNNNIIFTKLKIALSLQADDILEILESVDFKFSRHELSALFRSTTHKHYRECNDQVLRNFLNGLQAKHRGVE